MAKTVVYECNLNVGNEPNRTMTKLGEDKKHPENECLTGQD